MRLEKLPEVFAEMKIYANGVDGAKEDVKEKIRELFVSGVIQV